MVEVFRADVSTLAVLDPPPGSLTPGRLRYVECHALLSHNLLLILECQKPDQERVCFAAISYPWRGNHSSSSQESFRVPVPSNCEEGDPINVSILRTACRAAVSIGAEYLWLDRICIMQMNKEDKRLQIGGLSRVYKNCKASLVFPGGLQKLARVDEHTNWIHRAWTLQEAMPTSTYCIFNWKNEGGGVWGLTDGNIIIIEAGQSAMMDLGRLLQAAVVGFFHCATTKYDCTIFGENRDSVLALMGAKELKDRDMRDNAVWRSALMRTSSRPVDMVFSIMGIFGVELDVAKYNQDERERATMDLSYELLRRGRRATWVTASLGSIFLPSMSTMPQFPETTVEGKAFYLVQGKRESPSAVIGSGVCWGLKPYPNITKRHGNGGAFVLKAQTSSVKVHSQCEKIMYPTWQGLDFVTTIEISEGPRCGLEIKANLPVVPCPDKDQIYRQCRAIALGPLEYWSLPATASRAVAGAMLVLLLALEWNILASCWSRRSHRGIYLILGVPISGN
jgi:hypothetical protein